MVPQLVADMVDVTTADCWLWKRAVSDNGYGLIRRDGRLWKAHCWVYTQLTGPIPEGLDLDHLCRNRSCVNPAHLEPVTRQENIQRGNRGIVSLVCKYGHWKLGDNLYMDPTSKRRFCLTCARKSRRESMRRTRARARR